MSAAVLNINGTSADALIQALCDARIAVMDAMKSLQETAPNGRDFQTAPRGAYEVARGIYGARFAVLDKLANDLEADAIAIQVSP